MNSFCWNGVVRCLTHLPPAVQQQSLKSSRISLKQKIFLTSQIRLQHSTPHPGVDNNDDQKIRNNFETWTYQNDDSVHTERLFPTPKRWPRYNSIVHRPEDGPVERYICHHRSNIKYSPKKMWFVAAFIRGMSIDEALMQLSYVKLKGASFVKECLLEAQELAIKEQNFEFKSKMWVAESFATKGVVFKGLRKHARMRFGEIRYFHCHYYVKLVEGDPPPNYLPSQSQYNQVSTMDEKLNEHLEKLRQRHIDFGL